MGMVYLVYLIKDFLILLIFSLIISVLFNPAITFFQKKRIPRVLCAIVIYFGVFILLGLFIYKITPFLFSDLQQFVDRFSEYFDQASPFLQGLKIAALKDFQAFTLAIENVLLRASSNIFSALGALFGGVFATITIFSLAFFISLEDMGIERTIALVSPAGYRDKFLDIWLKAQKRISLWFATRIVGALYVGLFSAITCYVLDIKYAAFFGLIAGLSNFIITIGPLMTGAAIALFISLSSLPKALIFVLIFIIIQQIEGHILLPVLSKKFLHLPPAVVLISIFIGSRLWGILGAILAIPLLGMIFELVKGMLEKRGETLPPASKTN